jgi:hypothetical protein
MKLSGHKSIKISQWPMRLGAYTESYIYITCMNIAWEVQKCYQKLAVVFGVCSIYAIPTRTKFRPVNKSLTPLDMPLLGMSAAKRR